MQKIDEEKEKLTGRDDPSVAEQKKKKKKKILLAVARKRNLNAL